MEVLLIITAALFTLIGYAFGYMQSRPGAPVKTVEQARAILAQHVRSKAKASKPERVGAIKRPTAQDYRRKADPITRAR